MPTPADVAIITVQYNNAADTRALAESLERLEDAASCELVIVDNSTQLRSHDVYTLGKLSGWRVHVLTPPKNLYYWGGAAFALESLYSPNGVMPRWIIVCNNDLTIEDPLFLRKLRSLDATQLPVIAPRIVSQITGKDQNPLLDSPPGLFKRLKWRIYDMDYRIAHSLLAIHRTSKKALHRRSHRPDRLAPLHNARKIYAPHGACMIFSSVFFANGGELDTSVPMFAEELTIASQAEHLEMPVWYYPDLQVLHREHSTTGPELTRAKYAMERMARRHYYEQQSAQRRSRGRSAK